MKEKLPMIDLSSQACGLVQKEKEIVVGCMDNTLSSYQLANVKMQENFAKLIASG